MGAENITVTDNSGNSGKINAGQVASAAGNAVQSGLTAYSIYGDVHDAKDWLPRINSFQAGPNYGGSSFDSWTQTYLNNKPLGQVSLSDVGFNKGKNIWRTFESSHQGAMAGGSIVPGWGHLIGGVIGGIGGWIGYGAAKRKAKKTMNTVNNAIDYTNAFNIASLNNTLNNIRNDQYNNLLRTYAAYGGPLNMVGDGVMSPFGSRFAAGGPLHAYGSDWSNGLIFVNAGGSHEENPNEGVQMGVDPQGIPNLVEEGEVIYNDYVFSKRMRVPKKDKIKYKLGGLKLTYAEAAKKAQKESEERPNDPISQRGLEWIMAKLAESQETQREEKYMREVAKYAKQLGVSPEELLAMIEQQQAQQQPMMAAYGGSIHIKPSKRGTFTAAASKHGMGVQEFASKVLANKDDYSPAMVKKANFAKNAAGWKHELGGNLFWPGGIMWTSNIPPFFPKVDRKTKDNAYWSPGDWTEGIYENLPVERVENPWSTPTVYRKEDDINSQEEQILKDKEAWKNTSNLYEFLARYNPTVKQMVQAVGQSNISTPKLELPTTDTRTFEEKVRENWNENYIDPVAKAPILNNGNEENANNPNFVSTANGGYDWSTGLRFAPILTSAGALINNILNKPDYSRWNTLLDNGINDIKVTPKYNYMTYKPIDRMIMANMIGQQAAATRRNIMNTSGGNRGTAIAGLLASDNNYLNKLGEAFIAGDAENYKRYVQTLDTNNNINKWLADIDFNTQRANQAAAEARTRYKKDWILGVEGLDAARGAAISNEISNIAQGLGDIGWEQFNRNMVNSSNPLYSIDSSGRVFYDPQKMVKALGDDDGRRWMLLKSKYDNGNITDSEKKELDELYRKANVSVGGAYYGSTPVRANGGYLTIKRKK